MWNEAAAEPSKVGLVFHARRRHGFMRRRTIMRNATMAMLAVLAAGGATLAGSGPAAAYDYPWCVVGRDVGTPGDCSYQTYAQCMASASGRADYCNINPRVAFNRQPRGRYYRDY
jgi:hypothetical protein